MIRPLHDRPTPLANELCRPTWAVAHLALLLALVSAASAVARGPNAPAARHTEAHWHAFLPFDVQQPVPGHGEALGLGGHSLVAWRDASSAGLRIASSTGATGTPGAGEFLSELAVLGWREAEGRLQLLGLNDARKVVLEELDLRIVLPEDPIVVDRSSTVLQRLVPPDDSVVAPHGVLSPPSIPIDIRRGAADSRFGFQSLAPELELGLVTSWSENGELRSTTLVSLGASGHPSVPAHARAPGASAGSERGPAPGPSAVEILRGPGGSALAGTLRDSWLEGRQLRALVERESVEATTELVLLSAFLPDELDEPLAVAERVLFARDGLAPAPGTLVRLRLEAAGGDTVGTLIGWSPSDDSAGGDEPSGLSWTYVPDIPIPIPAGGTALPAPPFPIDTERGGQAQAGRYVPQVPEPIDFLPSPPFPIDTERGARARAGRHVPQVPEPIDFGVGDLGIGTLRVTLPSPTEPIELLAGLRVAEVVASEPSGLLYEAQFDHAPNGSLSTAWWSDGRIVGFHGLDAGSLPAVLLERADAAPIVLHVPHLPADVPLAMLLPSTSPDAPGAHGLQLLLPSAIEPPFEPIDWGHRDR